MFFNSHSIILDDSWLKKFILIHKKHPNSVISATGSWSTHRPSLPIFYRSLSDIPRYLFRFFVELNKVIKGNFKNFDKFPNYHLRSNAFIVQSTLFKNFIKDKKIPRTKLDCHILESGIHGFSSFLIRNRVPIYVVDKYGCYFSPEKFCNSSTFRSNGQKKIFW